MGHFDSQSLIGALFGLVLGWGLAYAMGAFRKQLRNEQALRQAERAEADRALAKVNREVQDLLNRANAQTQVFQYFPDMVRQLFGAAGARTIAPLALNFIEQLFHPNQAALFVARPPRKRLALVSGSGIPPQVKPGAEVLYGVGRLGYAAENRVAAEESDSRLGPGERPVRTFEQRKILESSGLPGIKAEFVAPILDEQEVLGVLCVSGAKTLVGSERRLLSMVADLTGVALVHANRMRASEQAGHLDGLTGVHNKRLLLERLSEELHKAQKEGKPLSLIILDIDHFEHYNRTNGNLQGDEVLKKLADLLKGSARESDIVGRFGGEEFIIVYVGAGKELAMRLGEKIRLAVEQFPFPNRQHQPSGTLTVSGGVATYPEDALKADNLIRSADQALFDAKSGGRNRIFPGEPSFLT